MLPSAVPVPVEDTGQGQEESGTSHLNARLIILRLLLSLVLGGVLGSHGVEGCRGGIVFPETVQGVVPKWSTGGILPASSMEGTSL